MRRHKATITATILSVAATAMAVADTPAPQQVVTHHIAALQKGDVDQLVSDYAPDAVVVLAMGSFSGLQQIRQMFVTYLAQDKSNLHSVFEATAEPLQNGMVIEHWKFYRGKPQESSGSDVIVVRGGKIVFHSMGPDAACTKSQ